MNSHGSRRRKSSLITKHHSLSNCLPYEKRNATTIFPDSANQIVSTHQITHHGINTYRHYYVNKHRDVLQGCNCEKYIGAKEVRTYNEKKTRRIPFGIVEITDTLQRNDTCVDTKSLKIMRKPGIPKNKSSQVQVIHETTPPPSPFE